MLADVRLGAEELVRFEHVGCSYGPAVVLEDVTFTVTEGDFVGVVGPSGGGKTTVLRAMLGTIVPSYGRVARRVDLRLGYVPQVEAVDWSFPVTVADVVHMTLPRPRLGRVPGRDVLRVRHVLERLGIAEFAGRHINALSGGQQQRVFLARALVHEPEVLVLDEPAGGVDVATRHEILHLLADLHHDGMSIVLTTHDINGLAAHLPRLVCLNRTVIADGPPADVLHPYVLERTYGAPMSVLRHGGMPVVLEHGHGLHARLQGRR
jgi:zinc/manganese transport system ATP-binding protein